MTAFSRPAPKLDVRTLDVRQLVDPWMRVAEVAAMTTIVRRLARATVGKRLLEAALSHGVQLDFASRFTLWYPGRGVAIAQYRQRSHRILLGRTHSPDLQLAALAHELQHFCDEVLGWGEGWTIQSEVRALQSEALVIRELELSARSRGLDDEGRLLDPLGIARHLRTTRFYCDFPFELPRPDGRLHSVLSNAELASCTGVRRRPRVWSVPVLVAGPGGCATPS